MEERKAWGVGLATVSESGRTLDVFYPQPLLGQPDAELSAQWVEKLAKLEKRDTLRGVHTSVVRTECDFDTPVATAADAYLRLHALSALLVKPNNVCLDDLFERLTKVVWTTVGPMEIEDYEEKRLLLRASCEGFGVRSIDRIPRLTDYIVPKDVRIVNGENVRLGAYLSPGTTVMNAGFINYNAGTLGSCKIEGRISQGVVVGDGTDLAGGSSTAGTLALGPHPRVSLGRNCLLGANSGLSIPLGDNCVVEAGLYLTASTKVYLMPSGGVMPGEGGFFSEPRSLLASELVGVSNALFRRNSESGRVEAISRGGQAIEFAD